MDATILLSDIITPFIIAIITCVLPFALDYYRTSPDRSFKRIEYLIDIYKNIPIGEGIQSYELEILIRLRIEIYESICNVLNARIDTSDEEVYIKDVPSKKPWEKFFYMFLFSSAVPLIAYFSLSFVFQSELSSSLIIQVIFTGLVGSLIGSVLVLVKNKTFEKNSEQKGKNRANNLKKILDTLDSYSIPKQHLEDYLGRNNSNRSNTVPPEKLDDR